MKKNTIAIVCEYNPFHNGHMYQIEKIKEYNSNADIIAIMSSSFTQRCGPSVISKWDRARQALSCGVDCVLELPVLFSVAPADVFARAGVYIADSIGIVDKLYFSAECENIEILKDLAILTESNEFREKLKHKLKSGKSYPNAMQEAIEDLTDNKTSQELKKPNNILGIEYIRAINKLRANIEPCLIKRKGAFHNEKIANAGFASGEYIRNILLNGNIEDIKQFVPEISYEILNENKKSEYGFASIKNIERILSFNIRTMGTDNLAKLACVDEGLENRIAKLVSNSKALFGAIEKIKTKRYTYSRLSRIMLYATLNIEKKDLHSLPQYVRALGVKKGKEYIIRDIKRSSKIPVVIKAKETAGLNDSAKRIFSIEKKASELYCMSFCQSLYGGQEYINPLLKL